MITPSGEQQQLRTTMRDFLAASCSHEQLRDQIARPAGFDGEIWRRSAAELGFPGLIVPEDFGGTGLSFADLVGAAIECGRVLYPGPVLASVLTTAALLATGDTEACATLLPPVAAGERVTAMAVAESALGWTPGQITATATGTGSARQVSGRKIAVANGEAADDLLVAARTESGVSLLHVPADATGVTRAPRQNIDPTRLLADISFSSATGHIVGAEGDGWTPIQRARDAGLAVLAAEAVGGIARLTDLAAEHARTRTQFGVPIGSFQAVKHRVADMVVAAEIGERSAETLMWAAALDDEQWPVVTSTIFAHNADMYVTVAESALQVHGGIGFTAEYPVHLYVKRARGSRALLGLPALHRERAADMLLIG